LLIRSRENQYRSAAHKEPRAARRNQDMGADNTAPLPWQKLICTDLNAMNCSTLNYGKSPGAWPAFPGAFQDLTEEAYGNHLLEIF